jgi:bifunctional DNA primase/polymerase-like protein/primase-like protein
MTDSAYGMSGSSPPVRPPLVFDDQPPMSELGEAALDYARRGWAVFPLILGGKRPLTANGFKDATTDLVTIRKLWTRYPLANIGYGIPINEMVADQDGPTDIELPATRTAKTPHGRHHYYTTDGRPVRQLVRKDGDPLDTRVGGRGYVVLPPSITPDGPYFWEVEREPAKAPGWVYGGPATSSELVFTVKDNPPIEQGGRNDALFRIASRWRGDGMSIGAIEAALLVVNRERCQPPLADAEVGAIAAQGGRYEPNAPSPNDPTAWPRRHVTLGDFSTDVAPEPLFGRLDPEHTILYGVGGSGKGSLSASWLKQLQDVGRQPAVLDFENHPTEWARRLFYLGGDIGSVPYYGPLGKDWPGPPGNILTLAPYLRQQIEGDGVDFLIIDSIIPAISGADPLATDAPTAYQMALGIIGLPVLSLGHVTKQQSMAFPFGSVMWHSYARVTWSLGKEGDILVLANHKANNSPYLGRYAVDLHWDNGKLLAVSERDFDTTLADRAVEVLADSAEPMTVQEIADLLNSSTDGQTIKAESIKRELNRDRGRFQSAGQSGRATKWKPVGQDDLQPRRWDSGGV